MLLDHLRLLAILGASRELLAPEFISTLKLHAQLEEVPQGSRLCMHHIQESGIQTSPADQHQALWQALCTASSIACLTVAAPSVHEFNVLFKFEHRPRFLFQRWLHNIGCIAGMLHAPDHPLQHKSVGSGPAAPQLQVTVPAEHSVQRAAA